MAGHVFVHGSTTPIGSVNVSVLNERTNEYHDGNDSKFVELTTNAQGEFQANLINFTLERQSGDVLVVSLLYNGLKDVVRMTIGKDSITNIVLTPVPLEVFEYERSLDEISSKILIYSSSKTFDEDYGSINSSSFSQKNFGEDVYGSVQVAEDEEVLEEEGTVNQGNAVGYFKIRYGISKDDIIRAPYDSSEYWRVMDKPVKHRFKNVDHHYEARLVKINITSL